MYSEETKLDKNNASADLILPQKRKLKKFLCTNSLLELVASDHKEAFFRRKIRDKRHVLDEVCHQVKLALVRSEES